MWNKGQTYAIVYILYSDFYSRNKIKIKSFNLNKDPLKTVRLSYYLSYNSTEVFIYICLFTIDNT